MCFVTTRSQEPTCLFNYVDLLLPLVFIFFFFNDTATTEIYTLSLHDALPICRDLLRERPPTRVQEDDARAILLDRSEEHTSELQSPVHLVCRLLLEKKKKKKIQISL